MGPVLPATKIRKPSIAAQILEGVSSGINSGMEIGSKIREGREKSQQTAKQNEYLNQLGLSELQGISPEIQKMGVQHHFAKDLKGNKLPSSKELESQQTQDIAQKSFNTLVELIPKVGRGSSIQSLFGGETAEHYGEFQSVLGGLEAALVDKVNRGTLSNARFEYITNTLLPKPTDTQAEIKGKLTGLAKILGLDSSLLTGETKETPKPSDFRRT